MKQRCATVLNATSAMSLFLQFLMSGGSANPLAVANTARINDMWEGRTEHTAFARLALRKFQENCAKAGVHINFPLPKT